MNEIENQVNDIIECVKTGKPKPITHVAFILDRSGSMDVMRKEAVQAFNEQVDVIRESSGENEIYLSLITFSTAIDEPILWDTFTEKGWEKLKLTEEKYVPNGMTSLYDAIGTTITRLDKENPVKPDEDVSFLIIIVSDGAENNSVAWEGTDLRSKIKELTDRENWTFTYLGTNQDVVESATSMNIPVGNTFSYQYSGDGMVQAGGTTSIGTRSYLSSRARGVTQVKNFYADSC